MGARVPADGRFLSEIKIQIDKKDFKLTRFTWSTCLVFEDPIS